MAILVAVLAMVILMFAAYAVDIGMQVNRKHQLNDTLDAAAQAGAYELPGQRQRRRPRRWPSRRPTTRPRPAR